MGMFFDDKPPPIQTGSSHKHGFFATIGIMLIGFVLYIFTLILKPMLTWIFTFEGRTRDQVTRQLTVALILFGTPLFLLYKIPFVRDGMSLSNTYTINVTDGNKIWFPDRSYFVPEGSTRVLNFKEAPGITYLTYPGYHERVAQQMDRRTCQMVTRSEKILISSLTGPVQAEGFENVVKYKMRKTLANIHGVNALIIYVANPTFLFRDTNNLSQKYLVEEETTWQEMLNNWQAIDTTDDGKFKYFEAKAKANEHAVACF